MVLSSALSERRSVESEVNIEGSVEELVASIESGADVDAVIASRSCFRRTALHLCAGKADEEAKMRELVCRGADVAATDRVLRTPLHFGRMSRRGFRPYLFLNISSLLVPLQVLSVALLVRWWCCWTQGRVSPLWTSMERPLSTVQQHGP